MNFVAIDFETANRYPTSACALGLVVVEGSEVVEKRTWLIKPTPNVFTFSFVHGIYPQDVENEPTFDEIWSEIRPFLEDSFVVAHNAAFDMQVLRRTLMIYDLALPKFNYACSIKIAKKVWKTEFPKYGLKFLANEFKIPLNHHNALSDTLACAAIMVKACEKEGVTELKDLMKKVDYLSGIKKFNENEPKHY